MIGERYRLMARFCAAPVPARHTTDCARMQWPCEGEPMVTPVISVVGKSGVGKTTFLEKLIPELKRRGLRVAVVKHDAHSFEIDHPGKDTWRHRQAGADVVLISSSTQLALIARQDHDASLDELVQMVAPRVDLVLTEGYKRGTAPKIEVSRRAVSADLLCAPHELLAVVTDHPLDISVPQFALDDAAGVAELLVQRLVGTG
jgi:molybdopterin-guanine dinucleotide biosynthesis protein B